MGKKLFESPLLSLDRKQACSQCHQLDQGGDDGKPRSITNQQNVDVINTPTIFNVAFNVRYTWRGKFKTLEQHADGSLHNPRHADTTWLELLPKLENNKAFRGLFFEIYDQPEIAKEMVLESIAVYERSLFTRDSAFDRYLRGDFTAINEQEKKGYRVFKQ